MSGTVLELDRVIAEWFCWTVVQSTAQWVKSVDINYLNIFMSI